jgi:hypothetical protein
MGHYDPIFMKIGTQTKKNMLSPKHYKTEVCGKKLQKLNVTRIWFSKCNVV